MKQYRVQIQTNFRTFAQLVAAHNDEEAERSVRAWCFPHETIIEVQVRIGRIL